MKNLLALVGAVVVLVGGLGWYLGWYKVGAQQGTPGHPKFSVEVESDKVKADLKKGKETVGEFIKDHDPSKGVPGQTTSLPLPGSGFELPTPPLPPLPPLPPPPSGSGVIPSDGPIPLPPPFAPGK